MRDLSIVLNSMVINRTPIWGQTYNQAMGTDYVIYFRILFGITFAKNYNKTREINEVTIPSVRKMLLSGNINRFIHSCFTDFDDKFADKFVENIREFRSKQKCIDTLENIIIKGDTRFY